MKQEGLLDFLRKHQKKNPISFHMPGHKGANLYRSLGYGDFMDQGMGYDITEIPGADNLFQAEGVIRHVMNRYKELYQVRDSYLLVNGTSGGLIAAILAAVSPGGKVMIARNSHKSIFNALSLGNLEPVFVYPSMVGEYGIAGPVTAKAIREKLEEQPEVEAVVLPSPNYYGICSDIKEIAQVVHQKEKVLIVDQAHGAHLKFFHRFAPGTSFEGGAMPLAAEDQEADLVVNSIHKTLASLTQSAVLNRVSQRVDRDLLEDKLQMIQSTSPSYLLMASLEINADILENHGAMLMKGWGDSLISFYQWAKTMPQLHVIPPKGQLDFTKLNLDYHEKGYTGAALEGALNDHEIYPELASGNLLMLMTGIGNTPKDFYELAGVLKTLPVRPVHLAKKGGGIPMWDTPVREKIPTLREKVFLSEAAGRVCASSIIPYPPGIPLFCPGEVIPKEAIPYLLDLRRRGEKVIGLTEKEEIFVGAQE
jgi:lysine decarboxylase